MNPEITIRSIQHFLYCPHRWGLLEIGQIWAENIFVTKGDLLHKRVHCPNQSYIANNKKTLTSVAVYNDLEKYNLYGIVDCLELTKDKNGVLINGGGEKYKISIIEYKPTKPKNRDYNYEDLMQVFAQKICVDYIFGCDCDGFIYYADVKKRVLLPLKDNFQVYDAELIKLLSDMRNNLKKGFIPAIEKGQNCNGCSLKDICMPTVKKNASFISEIEKFRKEVDN